MMNTTHKLATLALTAMLTLVTMPLRAQTLIDNYRFSTRVDSTAWIDITGVDSALIATPTVGCRATAIQR